MNNNIAIIINVKQFDEFEIFGTLEPKFVKVFGFTKMQHGCNSISGSSVLWYATLNNIIIIMYPWLSFILILSLAFFLLIVPNFMGLLLSLVQLSLFLLFGRTEKKRTISLESPA